MSNPTPDHNVTRDNQQQPPQWAVEAAKAITTDSMENVAYHGLIAMRAAIIAKHAPQPIPAPAAANGADIHRTPRTDATEQRQAKEQGFCGKCVPADFARELERENNALRARVAFLERELSKSESLVEFNRSLANSRLDGIEVFQAQLAAATSRADALQLECEKSREKQKELNRRCQHAESVIAKSGIAEGREQGPKNRSLGRALANYAAAQAYRERDTARDELAKWRDCAGKLAEALAQLKSDHQCTIDQYGKNGPQFTSKTGAEYYEATYVIGGAEECIGKIETALTAYRALAAGQGEGAGM